jgi:hypothetical protein
LLILAFDYPTAILGLRGARPGRLALKSHHRPGRKFLTMTTMSYRTSVTISMILAFTMCGIMIFAAISH